MVAVRVLFLPLAMVVLTAGSNPAQDESQKTDPTEVISPAPTVPRAEPAATHVARTTFTHAIENHEPVDEIATVSPEAGEVFFFTEIEGLDGETITHRWLHDGEVMAEVLIEIGGPRWRVYSSKSLLPQWSGQWTVQVVAQDGTILQESELNVGREEPTTPQERS